MKIALDAQVLMRNHARRMLIGAAEVGGHEVVLPVTAVTMAKLHYADVVRGYVTKRTIFETETAQKRLGDAALGRLVAERVSKLSNGFAAWIDAEPRRNDGAFSIGERTRSAQGVAMELARAQVVIDPKDIRWGVGEDPYVIAEALEAGAHWIASGNFATLKPRNMEYWLDHVQAQGRFTNVPRPFILEPEDAVATLLDKPGQLLAPSERITSEMLLAHALSEPKDPNASLDKRVAILTRFGSDLSDCGMTRQGGAIGEWNLRAAARIAHGRENEVWNDIEHMRQSMPKEVVRTTREAEDRRIASEAKQGTWAAPTQQRANKRGGVTR